MNILLTTFFHKAIPFQAFYDHMCKWLIDYFPQNDINIKFLITSEYIDSAYMLFETKQNYNLILFSDEDLEYFCKTSDITKITEKVINNTFSNEEQKKFNELLNKKIGDWTPDLIFSQSHISGKNIFGKIFPYALCLSTENAIFSRPPFLRTLSYDPYTAIPDNFPVRFAEEIKQFEITEEQNIKIEKLKNAITGIIDKYNNLDDEISFYYKQKFDKLVLLPLIGDKYVTLFKDCIYETELELIEQVLQKTPSNIGIFVTQADAYASLTPEHIEYLSNKYHNFIYLKKTDERGYANNSLNYFKYIDAVFNITSKTAFMAMLWDKPVLSLARTYNDWYKDGQGLDELEKVLNTPVKNKNNILYWYFTRYVLFEQDFPKENFLYGYIKTKLEKYRKNSITFEFFEEINSIDKVFDYIIKPVLEYYEQEHNREKFILQNEVDKTKAELNKSLTHYAYSNSTKIEQLYEKMENIISKNQYLDLKLETLTEKMNKPSLLQQIFSVKHEGKHKVWRVFGIKMKFRRK